MLLWVELALLLACIVIGARLGGIGLGTISGLGLLVYVFVFRMPPGGPPGTVLGMIIAVITALAAMQAGSLEGTWPVVAQDDPGVSMTTKASSGLSRLWSHRKGDSWRRSIKT